MRKKLVCLVGVFGCLSALILAAVLWRMTRDDSASGTDRRDGTLPGEAGNVDEPPYDVIHRAYSPYLAMDDPLGYPMKVLSMSSSPHRLWGGGKDLFFHWAKYNPLTRKWLEDKQAYVVQQGDQNLSNIGVYVIAGKGMLGALRVGLVDFDESQRMPFQFELLQGIITFRVAAGRDKIGLGDQQVQQLVDQLVADYVDAAKAVGSDPNTNADKLLKGEKLLKHMIESEAKFSYQDELGQYTDGKGHFLLEALLRRGEVKDILQPAMDRADAIAEGIAQAAANNHKFSKKLRVIARGDIRRAIKDIVARTHLGTAGSQGQKKYLVLMDKPLVQVDHDAMLYLKQQIPSAPTRQGLAAAGNLSPGQRCAEDTVELTDPGPYLMGWCTIGQESYTIGLKDPWSRGLETASINSFDDLLRIAHIWATITGASHRGAGEAAMIASRCNPRLASELVKLSEEYVPRLVADQQVLRADPRVKELAEKARAALAAKGKSID